MKALRCFCFFGFIILLNITIASCDNDDEYDKEHDGVYDYSYIQDPCQRVISPGYNGWKKYGFIMADVDGCYNPDMQCEIHLNLSSDYRITLRFQVLSTYCNDDVVIIIGETNFKLFCGFYAPTFSLYSSSNWLSIKFHTESATSSSSCQTGFKLYYTAYHTGECSDDEFRCEIDGRCIPSELKCDRYDNCGDWSDEKSGTCGLSTGAIIAISIISALVGLSLLAFILYCVYDRVTRRKTVHASENARRHRPPAEPTGEPVGPPEYAEPPPAYTVVNTVYAGVYEELDPNGDAPPSYQSVSAAP